MSVASVISQKVLMVLSPQTQLLSQTTNSAMMQQILCRAFREKQRVPSSQLKLSPPSALVSNTHRKPNREKKNDHSWVVFVDNELEKRRRNLISNSRWRLPVRHCYCSSVVVLRCAPT